MWSKSLLRLMQNYIFIALWASFINGQEQSHECERPCEVGAAPKNCVYWFKVEKYLVRSKACYDCPHVIDDCFRQDCIIADGFRRLVTVIDRKLPGPAIQICQGDSLEITVENTMTTENVAIHWHGIKQYGTPYMDGVLFLTQCPIHPLTTFKYHFVPKPSGSHFYHSHIGVQRGDGLFGALIVRKPLAEEHYKDMYDFDITEHILVINDWSHQATTDRYIGTQQGPLDRGPDTILINGLGRYQPFENENGDKSYTPAARFTVAAGKRYRFRLINAGIQYCPIELIIDNHLMKIIATDGFDIEMVEAESLTTYAGERWDFVIDANQPIDNYWMKFKGLENCDETHKSVFNVAVLHYEGAEDGLPKTEVTYENIVATGLRVNPVNVQTEAEKSLTVSELRSVNKDPDPALGPDYIREFLYFNMYTIDNPIYHKHGLYGFFQVASAYRVPSPQINHISNMMPCAPPLSQPENIDNSTYCDENTARDCVNNFCFCTQIRYWPLGEVIEIILVDEGKPVISNHPLHLHGFTFRVIAMEKVGEDTTIDLVKQIIKKNKFKTNLVDPVYKDTVTVPRGGFTIIRVLLDNPGYWLFHCHLEFHMEMGMSIIFKVGEDSDIPPVPKNFPRCGDFI